MSKETATATLAAAAFQLDTTATAVFETLKQTGQTLGGFGSGLVEALKDKKISGGEAFELTFLVPGVVNAVKNTIQVRKKWRLLSDDQKTAIAQSFSQSFDISNDQAENAIESIFTTAVTLEKAIRMITFAVGDTAAKFRDIKK